MPDRNVAGALLLLLLSIVPLSPLAAQQAWLMTYGTAERVEEQFGHNAIWIRDRERGIDSVYNFGFFDFDKPGFYREFVFGEMIYFALARAPEEELAYYRWRDRGVRAQLLDLSEAQVRRLTDWLEARIQPETREFRYDYYTYNCSNRVRDALDHALGGALSEYAKQRPAGMDFRAHTRRMLADAPLLYLGVEAALGRPADRPRTLWEEMFLPQIVAETVADMTIAGADGERRPLVAAERVLYRSTRPEDPAKPSFAWGPVVGLLAAGLALIGMPATLARRRGAALAGARAWIVLTSLAGALLGFLWIGTDHEAAWRNENLLLFNPLALLLIRFRAGPVERFAALLLAAGLVLSLVLKALPGAQWNYEMLAWMVPAQALLLWVWWSRAHAGRAGDDPERGGSARPGEKRPGRSRAVQ